MANGKFVSYLRVSTRRQGASGLGLDAQRQAVADFLNGGRWSVIQEIVEVESGKRDDRPKLAEAMALCRIHGATLVRRMACTRHDLMRLSGPCRSQLHHLDVSRLGRHQHDVRPGRSRKLRKALMEPSIQGVEAAVLRAAFIIIAFSERDDRAEPRDKGRSKAIGFGIMVQFFCLGVWASR